MKNKNTQLGLCPEWEQQDAVQLTWPHVNSDWEYCIEDVRACFKEIARAILRFQSLIIVTPNPDQVKKELQDVQGKERIKWLNPIDSNDTWARDHAALTVRKQNGTLTLLDFGFNGWGLKFSSDKDNQIVRLMAQEECFKAPLESHLDMILEGGSLEVDGQGTLLTTSICLLEKNRNPLYSREELENELKRRLGVSKVLWLDNGYLRGDDTDSHIDTLARFCDERTIAYVECEDAEDEHFDALSKMKMQLQSFTNIEEKPYRLVALPMVSPIIEDGERLPATYANFLIINGAVLLPIYNQETDEKAIEIVTEIFPDREIVPIDCSVLIRQHGSLHCVTMQFPKGTINL